MKNEKLNHFTKHPFEEFNQCKKVDFERIQKDMELFIDFYNQKYEEQKQFDA
jgi:hypothetical protein